MSNPGIGLIPHITIIRKVQFLIILITGMFCTLSLSGQIISIQDQLQYEISKRGISQEEFEELMLDAGIDPDNLNELSPAEVDELQRLMEDFERDRFFRQRRLVGRDTIDTGLDEKGRDTIIVSADTTLKTQDTLEEAIFGHQLFRSGQISLIASERGYNPPETYILGVGDEVIVSIFGNVAIEKTHIIRADGSVLIFDDKVKVTLAGLNVQEARMKLERAYRREYRFSPNQFSLYVSTVRTIRVQVYGEVVRPGDYTVSAANGITNILAAAGGMTDIGSVRNIQLVKRSGLVLNYDLYALLSDPDYQHDFTLENGDYIIVQQAEKVVRIEGAVNRPHNYELKPEDGLFELIEFAGGLGKGAYLGSIKINRYTEDRRIVKDVPYAERVKQNQDYPLEHGDEVMVKEIQEELENYVTVRGEVRNEGNYELIEGMSLRELLLFAGVKPSTKTDFATLRRINQSGNVNLIPVSIEDALNGIGPSSLITLQDRDELIVWAKGRFTDDKYIKIAGAVRNPEQFDYDDGGTLRAADLINLAGGLRTDAADFAHIHRLDPLNPNDREYITVDLHRMFNDPNSADNIFLEPYDSLYVYSKNEFLDDVYIKVSGAVNNPGEFMYGTDMRLNDAIILAGGFKRSSATNRIEVSRVIIEDNQPTRTIVEHLTLNRDDLKNGNRDAFTLKPYDNIFVRYVPQFELQQNVVIRGEVTLPGEYSLIKDNETVFDIIQRAGGLTEEAFPAAAKLYRAQDSLGFMLMRLDEVMLNPSSQYNQPLAHGDTITIPKIYNYVKIIGATQSLAQNQQKQVVTPYHKGKDALFYINNYSGGFADDARRDKIFVKYANGEIKTSKKRFLLGKKYPEVLPGSEIIVGKIKRDLRSERDKEDVNWTKVLGDSVAQAMSILTLILLVQRLD